MKYIQYIICPVLFLTCFLLLEGPMFYIPYYHEQHHLFLFTQTYLNCHLSTPGQPISVYSSFTCLISEKPGSHYYSLSLIF